MSSNRCVTFSRSDRADVRRYPSKLGQKTPAPARCLNPVVSRARRLPPVACALARWQTMPSAAPVPGKSFKLNSSVSGLQQLTTPIESPYWNIILHQIGTYHHHPQAFHPGRTTRDHAAAHPFVIRARLHIYS